jgi:peptidoglycan hydrolase-like protein with peptidoglycan-binding domain
MKTTVSILLFIFALSISTLAQTTPTTSSSTESDTSKKRPPIFKANKDQIMQAQKMLKDKGMYAGEQTGKLDDATREGLTKYQTAEAMTPTGTLNRATLEKMNIALTEKQTAMPAASEKPKEPKEAKQTKEPKEKGTKSFRATKDQVMQAQKMLKGKSLYMGEEDGKRNDDFRAAVAKYQQAEGLKATGTLNRETLDKMGISLTDKQKAMPMMPTTPSTTK